MNGPSMSQRPPRICACWVKWPASISTATMLKRRYWRKHTNTRPRCWCVLMLTMTLKKLNKEIPVSQLGPDWDGVKVLVTETGFDALKRDADPYGFNLGTHVGDSLTHVQARRSLVEK